MLALFPDIRCGGVPGRRHSSPVWSAPWQAPGLTLERGRTPDLEHIDDGPRWDDLFGDVGTEARADQTSPPIRTRPCCASTSSRTWALCPTRAATPLRGRLAKLRRRRRSAGSSMAIDTPPVTANAAACPVPPTPSAAVVAAATAATPSSPATRVRLSISTPSRTAATITQASQAGISSRLSSGRVAAGPWRIVPSPWPGCSRTACPGAHPRLGVNGREGTCVRLRCGHFFGRCRRAAAAIAAAAAINSSVDRVSRPKMTSATPLSTRAASAFRPGPRKCRRTAGCLGGSLVPMSFTSTNTNSNSVLFILLAGRRGARVPRRHGTRLSISGNGTALDRVSGVERAARRGG